MQLAPTLASSVALLYTEGWLRAHFFAVFSLACSLALLPLLSKKCVVPPSLQVGPALEIN